MVLVVVVTIIITELEYPIRAPENGYSHWFGIFFILTIIIPGHFLMLQRLVILLAPEHRLPPKFGGGFVQLRMRV